jgi:tetratricopeptide (TPR) repeat protein
MKEFLCDWILSCVLAVQPVTPLPDLYYGSVLYDYYQDDYQQALLDALIVERRGVVGSDPVRLQLAKGSFAFADGMFAMAEQTFASVGDGELTPLDKMRLSFHLAREDFRRQNWAGVERNLANIDLGKSWLGHERIHPEVEFMRAEVATQHGDFAAAQAAIARIDPKQPFRAYALFNLGVAMRSAGQVEQAQQTFATLAAMDVYEPDALDLKQRALVALSLIKRQRAEAASAESVLGGLPADGRYRDLALTSYGGLAMDNGNYELAARIWLSLKKDAYWSESSATAQLGFPMSLEHMSSRELALTNYRAAEANFENRLTELHGISARAQDPVWIGGLLKVFAQPQGDDTTNDVMDEWRKSLGHTDWLEWLATEDVQELLQEWRQLHAMQDWLTALPEELSTFDALAAEQRRRAAAARELIDTRGLVEQRAQVAAQLSDIHARINTLEAAAPQRTSDWMLTLADADEAKLLNNLSAKRALLMQTPDDETRRQLLARINYLEGIAFWNLVDEAGTRLRDTQKAATQTGELLTDIDSKLTRVAHAESAIAAGVQTDFLAFQTRADAITAMVAVALADRETRLGDQIRSGIHREIAQVERQLLVTRIAIARATDELALEKTDADVAQVHR